MIQSQNDVFARNCSQKHNLDGKGQGGERFGHRHRLIKREDRAVALIARRGDTRDLWRDRARAVRTAADRKSRQGDTRKDRRSTDRCDARGQRDRAIGRALDTVLIEPGLGVNGTQRRPRTAQAHHPHRSPQIHSDTGYRSKARLVRDTA